MNKVGLVYDRIRWDEKALIDACKKSGLGINLIDCKEIFIDTSASQKTLEEEFGETVLQRCISYFRGLHITAVLETAGLNIINPLSVSQICGNKLFTTLTLQRAGVPVPKTFVAFTEEGASKALDSLGYPAVAKPVVGSWGRLIALIRDRETAQAIIESREEMPNSLLQIYYLQEYVKRPPRDIRILVVGDETIAASYRYSHDGEWRTNIARGGKSEPCPMNCELEDISLKAAEAVGGGVLAVDCMESPRGVLVHEVNNTAEFKGLCSATNIDIPGKIIEYVKKVTKK